MAGMKAKGRCDAIGFKFTAHISSFDVQRLEPSMLSLSTRAALRTPTHEGDPTPVCEIFKIPQRYLIECLSPVPMLIESIYNVQHKPQVEKK